MNYCLESARGYRGASCWDLRASLEPNAVNRCLESHMMRKTDEIPDRTLRQAKIPAAA